MKNIWREQKCRKAIVRRGVDGRIEGSNCFVDKKGGWDVTSKHPQTGKQFGCSDQH